MIATVILFIQMSMGIYDPSYDMVNSVGLQQYTTDWSYYASPTGNQQDLVPLPPIDPDEMQ